MNPKDDNQRLLCDAGEALFAKEPGLGEMLGFDPAAMATDGDLIAEVLARASDDPQTRDGIRAAAKTHFRPDGALFHILREDVIVTSLRDDDPAGPAATLFTANGLHCLLGYRLTNALHRQGETVTALVLKTHFLRAFGADIMPQATIGRRVWVDHGLGVVIGQTAIIEDDVSLWHGVTLGTNLVDRGASRHPRLRRGCVIGAGAQIIGPVEIGEHAVVAAGATVVDDVPPGAVAVSPKSLIHEGRARSAAEMGIPIGELP
ncbi:serine O-acetyltransferase [Paracoccaceae bacterium GXU_MW_L88]